MSLILSCELNLFASVSTELLDADNILKGKNRMLSMNTPSNLIPISILDKTTTSEVGSNNRKDF